MGASPLSLLAMTGKPNKISHCERPQGAWQSQKQIMTQPPRGEGRQGVIFWLRLCRAVTSASSVEKEFRKSISSRPASSKHPLDERSQAGAVASIGCLLDRLSLGRVCVDSLRQSPKANRGTTAPIRIAAQDKTSKRDDLYFFPAL